MTWEKHPKPAGSNRPGLGCLLMVSSEKFSSKAVSTMMDDPPPGMGILPVTSRLRKKTGSSKVNHGESWRISFPNNGTWALNPEINHWLDDPLIDSPVVLGLGPGRFARSLDRWWMLASTDPPTINVIHTASGNSWSQFHRHSGRFCEWLVFLRVSLASICSSCREKISPTFSKQWSVRNLGAPT